MTDNVYKQIELTGSSKVSIEDAISNAITKSSETIRNLRWFKVVDTRGHIEDGKVQHWQVSIKVGFTMD